jgi:hypothetical protein
MLRRVLLILSVVGLLGSLGGWILSRKGSVQDGWAGIWSIEAPTWEYGSWSVSFATNSVIISKEHQDPLDCATSWHGATTDLFVAQVSRAFQAGGPFATSVRISLWAPIVVCMACPMLALLTETRQLIRRRLGLCFRCGYDLRGTPGPCSECGQPRE